MSKFDIPKRNVLLRTLSLFLFFSPLLAFPQLNFLSSSLKGVVVDYPTSLQFGPDSRLYVGQQNGIIKIFTIKRNGANDYTVTATETINLINLIPNHDDDGLVNPGQTIRQVTGILVKGTEANPVIYVTSSDIRYGANGDVNLDTNSGILSLLTWNGSTWVKVDLVRGLPRSEENHSVNGMQLDEQTNTLYLNVGGITNAGGSSAFFAYTNEYALSAAILSINLNAINAMPTKGSGNTAYKYDLPTLDDPTRANNPDGSDINDPFGGNDGLNQAKIVIGGPVQVYSPGHRNAYDLVITKTPGKARRMYTIDNGANPGVGGYPEKEGTGAVTNNYVVGEPGSNGPGVNELQVNNLDNLHYIGNLDTYVPGSLYGGHPNPIRANPAGAGLYTHNGTTGVWRTSKTGPNPLPVDWPPVPLSKSNPIEGDFQMPGVADLSLLTFEASVNGIAEYTASNFNNILKGSLLACGWDNNIYKISLTEDGTNVTNSKNITNKLNQDPPFASGFKSMPLDITTQGDNDIFPGSVWVAVYGLNDITIFEPNDFLICVPGYNNSDGDKDGYTNADEIDNKTDPCSAISIPPDADKDFISDLNDPDDDNDGLTDDVDYFALDANNGLSTSLRIKYDFFNNDPGTGLFGLGFTGLMGNKKPGNNYINLFDNSNLVAGAATGSLTVVSVPGGDALGTLNTQQNGFQFGVKIDASAGPFTVQSRMTGPFFNNKVPQNYQSQGIYIGIGDQDNYFKITLNANAGKAGIQVVNEIGGVPVTYQFALPGGLPSTTLDLFLAVNPLLGTIQPKYAINGGEIITLGSPIELKGSLLNIFKGNAALAVGLISTSRGATPFTATWDFINITNDAVTVKGNWQTIKPSSGSPLERDENGYVQAGNNFYLLGGRSLAAVQAYNFANKTWASKAKPPVNLHDFQAISVEGLIYVVGAFAGNFPRETPVDKVYIYNPVSDKWLNGSTIPASRRRGAAGAVAYKDKIYLIGGIKDGHWNGSVNWFDEYDPSNNTWKALPEAPRARDHFQAAIVGNKLYVAGGRRTSGSTNNLYEQTIPQVDVYDFATGKWSSLPEKSNLPTERASASVAVLGDELIVIGGESSRANSKAHDETEALNVTSNTWRRLDDLKGERSGTQAINSNNGIYIIAGAGRQGGKHLVSSQEAFYMFTPTTPASTPLSASNLTASGITFDPISINAETTKTVKLTNTGSSQAILVSSISLNGSNSFSIDNSVPTPFIIPVGKSIDITIKYKPLSAGQKTGSLIVNHSGQGGSTTALLSGKVAEIAYRINAGGGEITNSIGTFVADNYFSPTPGNIYSNSAAISATDNDGMYQTERWGSPLGYVFPVPNGQYTVVLHFAELIASTVGQRVFDVSLEGTKVLSSYDIFKKVGSFTATLESFTVNVTDGNINIDFNALVDNAKISAIEIVAGSYTPLPIAYAGQDKTVYLPNNIATLSGAGSSTITSFNWSQVSGPNTAYLSSKTDQNPVVSGLIAGTYVFSLVVTNSQGVVSVSDQVNVTVNPANTIVRINAGSGEVTNSIGTFSADNYFSPTSGNVYSTNAEIAGTVDDAIYQTERWGSPFSYSVPVVNGQHTVVLHFAELVASTIGQRVFDVSIEGKKVLDNYDIFKKVGALTAATESFTVNVTDGILNIDFSALAIDGGVDNAKVSAIEIITNNNQTPALVSQRIGSVEIVEGEVTKRIKIYPNPIINGQFKVTLPQEVNGQIRYKLFSSIGEQLAFGKLNLEKFSSTLNFNFNKEMQKPGIYYLNLEGKNLQVQLKIKK